MALSVAHGERRTNAGPAVHDDTAGGIELGLVARARGVGEELEQSPRDLHGALDVVLPLHRFTDV